MFGRVLRTGLFLRYVYHKPLSRTPLDGFPCKESLVLLVSLCKNFKKEAILISTFWYFDKIQPYESYESHQSHWQFRLRSLREKCPYSEFFWSVFFPHSRSGLHSSVKLTSHKSNQTMSSVKVKSNFKLDLFRIFRPKINIFLILI